MSVRRAIVDIVDLSGLNVAAFCREHGVSEWFFYDLRRRFPPGSDPVLGSRAAKQVANKTEPVVEDRIIEWRKRLADQGLDNGPGSIRDQMIRAGDAAAPSEATIWRILSRRGFIVADPSKAPKRAVRRFQADRANARWQIDDTGYLLADGTEVKIINVVDDCSRLNAASLVVNSCTAARAFDTIAAGAERYGWPEKIQRDNAKTLAAAARSLGNLGIGDVHSRPNHPQTNGKVERFHQTQKRYLSVHGPYDTLEALQQQVDTFRELYNEARPHRSLQRRTPLEVWTTTPKSGPADGPIDAPTEIFRTRVHAGYVTLGMRYRVGIGTEHTGNTATVVLTGNRCHVFVEGRLAHQLTIDPTRRVQARKSAHPKP